MRSVSLISSGDNPTFPKPDRPGYILLGVHLELVFQRLQSRVIDLFPIRLAIVGTLIHGSEFAVPDGCLSIQRSP
jgi:hypothetical protein